MPRPVAGPTGPQHLTPSAIQDALSEAQSSRPEYPWIILWFPNTVFGIALGLGGHSALWKQLADSNFTGESLGYTLNKSFWWAGVVMLCALSCFYTAKGLMYPGLIHAEWRHPVRSHFFNIVNLALLTLTIGTPPTFVNLSSLRGIFLVCLTAQSILTQQIYARWLFDETGNIGHARPPFLLSTVGWLLLTILGQISKVREATGLDFPAFCFGAGSVLYFLVLISVFLAMHNAIGERGSPVLFLMLAPPSIASVALASLVGEFDTASSAVFGWTLVILVLLLRLSPQLLSKPVLLGTYW